MRAFFLLLKKFWIPLLLSVLFYTLSDVLLKIGNFELQTTLILLLKQEFLINFVSNLAIILALGLTVLAKIFMGIVLAKNPLGLSEGLFLGITALLLFISGITIFHEIITPIRVAGALLVSGGILLVYYEHYQNPTKN
jgi:multidrug transporter EmrE-like cation transporter